MLCYNNIISYYDNINMLCFLQRALNATSIACSRYDTLPRRPPSIDAPAFLNAPNPSWTATFLQQSHRVELVTRRRVRAVNKAHLPICGEGRRRREHMSCAASSPHDSTSLPQHAHVLCVLLGNSLCTGTDSRCLAASPRSTGDRPRRRRPGAANTRPHSRAAGRPAGWATWAGSLRGAVVSDLGTRRRTQEQAGRQVGG